MQVSPVWSSVAIRVVTTVKMQSQHPQLSTTSSDNDGVKLKTNFLQWKVLALPWKIITWGFGRLFMMLMSWPWSQWIGTNNKDNSLWFTHIERREGSKINDCKTQNVKFPSKRVFSRSSQQFLWDFPLQRERDRDRRDQSGERKENIFPGNVHQCIQWKTDSLSLSLILNENPRETFHMYFETIAGL